MAEEKIEVKTVVPETEKVEAKTEEESKTDDQHTIYDGESVAVSARMIDEELKAIQKKADEKK